MRDQLEHLTDVSGNGASGNDSGLYQRFLGLSGLADG